MAFGLKGGVGSEGGAGPEGGVEWRLMALDAVC